MTKPAQARAGFALALLIGAIAACSSSAAPAPVDAGAPADTGSPDAQGGLDAQPPTRVDLVGAGCNTNGDCGDGAECTAAPGGFCTWTCAASADCGPIGVCAVSGPGRRFCYRLCTNDADCRAGSACIGPASATELPLRSICYPKT